MEKITSKSNERIKKVVALRNHRKRKESGLSIAEGMREVEKLIESKHVLKELYCCEDTINENHSLISESNVPAFSLTNDVFEKISYGDRNEGVLAVFEPSMLTLKDISCPENGLFVVVEEVEKPGNLGAILRTCDGAGVDGIFVCDVKTDIFNPNVIRASLGTVFSAHIVAESNEAVYEYLNSNQVTIFATTPQTNNLYTKSDLTKSTAIVVGSEEKGLSAFWLDHADEQVKIPMNGINDSLNVSTSVAILLYEALRQRS